MSALPEPVQPLDDLVRRAQAGDRVAFEGLYRECAGRSYALCLRLTGNPSDALDLLQDTFIRAWERLDGYRGEAALSSWLHRLTVNAYYQQRRAERRRHARVMPAAEPPEGPGIPASDVPNRLDLEAAIGSLPDGAREVFVLYDIEGYTHEEIGRMVGIAVGTSKAHLHRARRLLRERLTR